MAEGRLQMEWAQTSEILALIYNANRPPKFKAIPSWKFNPFGKAHKAHATMPREEAWSTFRTMFDRGVFGGKRQ